MLWLINESIPTQICNTFRSQIYHENWQVFFTKHCHHAITLICCWYVSGWILVMTFIVWYCIPDLWLTSMTIYLYILTFNVNVKIISKKYLVQQGLQVADLVTRGLSLVDMDVTHPHMTNLHVTLPLHIVVTDGTINTVLVIHRHPRRITLQKTTQVRRERTLKGQVTRKLRTKVNRRHRTSLRWVLDVRFYFDKVPHNFKIFSKKI